VAERVFHQGLQQQRGDHRVLRFVLDFPHHLKPVGEAHELDRQILLYQRYLFAQRTLVGATAVEHASQNVAEQHGNANRFIGIAAREQGDSVKRVEQHVRMQLCAQRMQLRAGKLRFQLQCAPLALAIARCIFQSETRCMRCGVQHQRHDDRADEHRLDQCGREFERRRPELDVGPDVDRGVQDERENQKRNVHSDGAKIRTPLHGKSSRKREHDWRERYPHVPSRALHRERSPERNRVPLGAGRYV